MTTGKVNKRVIGDRFGWIERMVAEIKRIRTFLQILNLKRYIDVVS